MKHPSLAFIGAGHLTQALIAGLLSHQYDPKKIWVFDPIVEKLAALEQRWGICIAKDNQEAIAYSEIVVLAVKPVHLHALCTEISAAVLHRQPLIISVAAGVTIALLERWLSSSIKIIRAMPNTPATIQAGITGLYASGVSAALKKQAEEIFRAVGVTLWAEDEGQLDAICAISGCGPGYVFLLMEAVEAAARQQGLSAAAARLLTMETFLGAAKLALAADRPLEELRNQVASPQGATEKAIQSLEQNEIRHIISAAIIAARQRCIEINKEEFSL